MCVSWGMRVTREHSTPRRASPLRELDPSCQACVWLGQQGTSGPRGLTPGPPPPFCSPGAGGTRGGPCLRPRTHKPPAFFS